MNSISPVERQLRQANCFLPKDFVEAHDGLFAVVAAGVERGRVLTWLRYVRDCNEPHGLRKVGTAEAQHWLVQHCPSFRFHSQVHDAALHGVPEAAILRHWRPTEAVERVLADPDSSSNSALKAWLDWVPPQLRSSIGVTGSVLLNTSRPESDVDVLVYGKQEFFELQTRVEMELSGGTKLRQLDATQWRDVYARRGCSLTLAEYVWHEGRKFSKFTFAGQRFDLSCVDTGPPVSGLPGKKLGPLTIEALVTNADDAFLSPAVYRVDHPEVDTILATTPTYAGQAYAGEWIEAAGTLEEYASGRRLVIGSSREAAGEFLRVLR